MQGRVVAGFHVQSPLGTGCLGKAWSAYRHQEKRWFVLKFPRWKQVASAIKGAYHHQLRMGHPQILDCAGAGRDKHTGGSMVAFPFISRSLYTIIKKKKRLPAATATQTLMVLLKILSFVEKKGFAHGLLTPNNLLIDKKGKLVLTDFSVGEIVRELDMAAFLNHVQRRPENGCPEPLHFLSPHRRLGCPAAIEEDLFSCGRLFYYMLTGEANLDVSLGLGMHPNVPVELARAILKLTDPHQGLTSVAQAWQIFATIDLKNLTPYAPDAHPKVGSRRTRRRGEEGRVRMKPLRSKRSPTRIPTPKRVLERPAAASPAARKQSEGPEDEQSGHGWPTVSPGTSSGMAWGGDPAGSDAFPGTKKIETDRLAKESKPKPPIKKAPAPTPRKKQGYGGGGQWGTSLPPTWGESDD